jgi:hypothetical protein
MWRSPYVRRRRPFRFRIGDESTGPTLERSTPVRSRT